MKKLMTVAALAATFVAFGVPGAIAHPDRSQGKNGHWVLNTRACPDLVEDRLDRRENRRDERYDHGRRDRREDVRDRREDRRDRAVTICPASAWQWTGPQRARPRYRQDSVQIYYNDRAGGYFYYGDNRTRIAIRF